MTDQKKSIFSDILHDIRSSLIAGLLTVVPLGITYIIINFLFKTIDGFLSDFIKRGIGHSIPGLGIVLSFLLLYLIGLFARNVVGRTLIGWGEKLLEALPFVKNVYQASKQLIATITLPGKKNFKRVVVIAYPHPGLRALAFVTGEFVDSATGEQYLSVFVPTTPNPTSGLLEFVKTSDTSESGYSVEDAIKLIVSAGILSPNGKDGLFTKTGS